MDLSKDMGMTYIYIYISVMRKMIHSEFPNAQGRSKSALTPNLRSFSVPSELVVLW